MERNLRTKTLTGSLEEIWRKDLNVVGLRGLPASLVRGRVDIAPDAERVVFGSLNKRLHIFNFDGVKEREIEVRGSIDSIAVTSDCSRILCGGSLQQSHISDLPRFSLRRLIHKKRILVFNSIGEEELNVDMPESDTNVMVSTSLDGKISAARGKLTVTVWDWKGNLLGGAKLDSLGLQKIENHCLAPDGNFIAFKLEGTGANPMGWYVRTIPNVEDLLNIPELEKRSDMWMLKGIYFYESGNAASAANNRLTHLQKKRSICIFDIRGDNFNTLLCNYELVDKPEFISQFKMTSDGKYLYYLSHNKRENKISFNIFDVEKRTIMKELLTFPNKEGFFISSHDGSKLLTIVGNEVTMLNVS